MEGRQIVLKDGTKIKNSSAGYADGYLWIYLSGYPMIMAINTFMNPAKTELIRFQYGEMEDTYEGFTKCINIMDDQHGQVSVCLTKP